MNNANEGSVKQAGQVAASAQPLDPASRLARVVARREAIEATMPGLVEAARAAAEGLDRAVIKATIEPSDAADAALAEAGDLSSRAAAAEARDRAALVALTVEERRLRASVEQASGRRRVDDNDFIKATLAARREETCREVARALALVLLDRQVQGAAPCSDLTGPILRYLGGSRAPLQAAVAAIRKEILDARRS